MNAERQEAILDFWRSVELFSPQTVPELDPRQRISPVFAVNREFGLPWDDVHPMRRRNRRTGTRWRYTFFCGVYDIRGIRALLEEKLCRGEESFDERPEGESCLFAFSATEEGRPLFDSFLVSSCAWAVSRTRSPGPADPGWLRGFEEESVRLAEGFRLRFAIDEDDQRGHELTEKGFPVGRSFRLDELAAETARIRDRLDVAILAPTIEIRVRANLVAAKSHLSVDGQDFLNSFFLRDLDRVKRAVRAGDTGKALSNFLRDDQDLKAVKRIDVRRDPNFLWRELAPGGFPAGRWPSMNHLPLAFSQQLAIDSIWRRLAEGSGSFAINGPPGTGKTTVLRDLVAAVMVERAKRLARLADPESAFVGKRNWRVGKFSRAIAVWRDELRGFEMVVASSNNGAVENVTLEIPMREAIDPGWLPGAEHFAGFATEVAGRPCWALLAARLGNKQNRGDFVRRFWYGEETEDERSDEEGKSGFLAYLKRLATEPFDWRDEVRRFASALRSENEIRERRTSWARTVEELPAAEATLVCAEREREAAVARRDDSNARFTAAEAFAQKSEAARVLAAKRRLDHRAFRPGFWETVFTWGKVFREWRARDLLLARDLEKEEEDVRAAAARVSECGSGRAARAAELAQVEARLSQAGVAVVRLRIDLAQAASALGDAFPDPAAWRDPSNEAARELSAPWSDRAWSDARAAVFIAALRLHRAFLAANAGRMRMSLQAAMDVLSGNVPEEAPREAVAHAWSALFFIAPVVSTTFASFDRLFSHLGRESLGWLLIDEAGQATPQAAVGALWRARRAVVVGDPLQLEPVVTIPLTVQQALRRHFRVAETWLPGGTSLQELADRASEIGTYLASDEGEDRWVGAPLRVHRRCESPMFEISNQIAYGGAMVYGTPVREPYSLPPSCWLDVAGGEADSHWIEAEGRALGDLLTELRLHGVDPADVFLISPFRAVVAELSAFVRQHDGLRAGTIHTMQGKESKVVILVLGGNPKKPGAKAWAARTPNLLNVAVSRAQRRLYVIGNRAAWSRERFFSRLARHLPSRQRPG